MRRPPSCVTIRVAEQLALPLVAPSRPVDMSREAAASVSPDRARTLRRQVYALLVAYGGLTADECAERLGLDSHSVGPRLWELERLGLVEKSSIRRRTRAGRYARVYVLTEGGHDGTTP